MPFDLATIQTASVLSYVLVFVGGIITSIGPCNIATVPLIMGYVGGSQTMSRGRAFALSLTFAIGLAITFMMLGVVAALIGAIMGVGSVWWYYLVAAVCIVIGLQMIGALSLRLPARFSDPRQRITLKGIPGALALGLVSRLVASQCATPVLAAILTYVMVESAMLYGASLLFVYALGRGVPVVLAGAFAGALKQMLAMGRWSLIMERVAGVLMIGVGGYFLWIA